jgi:DNA uptake protein ComE-like DNA-binding protein
MALLVGMSLVVCVRAVEDAPDGKLEHWEHVEWVEHPSNDGDSFSVRYNGVEYLLRLYYVDAPETSAGSETDARRVREQSRYFGLESHRDTVHFGQAAADFTRTMLAKPFTVYTARATAPGRSVSRRIYAFVKTADGEDLAALLVARGLARAYGVRRALPDGTSAVDAADGFSDLESAAMLDRAGLWAASNAKRLISARAEARQEVAELRQIHSTIRSPAGLIDINTADLQELEMLPGVGPVTARNIVANRPFRKPEDLLRVPRITSLTVTNILPHLKWATED